jgi:UDP-N-acetylmuramoylalanine--D-glutamate ligase
VTVLVEGFEPDAVAVARLLAREGHRVRLAGPGDGPARRDAAALEELGVSVEPRVDLDDDVGDADIAYLDVWTAEVARRVRMLRERGCRLTCAADLVLERAAAPVVGVTGTAGKTTASAFAAQLFRLGGLDVLTSSAGRFGNLWPGADLVGAIAADVPADVVVLELTSSHLAFVQESPPVAVVTSFWPDHVELHGSVAAYRRAKEAIVRHQTGEDVVVVNADDAGASSFASLTPARCIPFSERGEVGEGAFVRSGEVVARREGVEVSLGPPPDGAAAATLAAVAAVVAAHAPLEPLAGRLGELESPPHRRQPVAHVGEATVVDDGMAATPAKTARAISGAAAGSVVLIAGGLDALLSGPVHASVEERALLEAACDEIARTVRLGVLFGPAASLLEPLLRIRGVPTLVAASLDEAVPQALAAAGAASTVLFSPMFPVETADRARFAALVREASARHPGD